MPNTTTQSSSPLGRRTFVTCGQEGDAFVVRVGFPTQEQAELAQQFIVDAGQATPPSVPGWFDMAALDLARRFTLDTEPQRRASLQVAVVEAMQLATSQRGGALEGGQGPNLWWLCEAANIDSGAVWTRQPDAEDIAWVSREAKREHIALRLVPQHAITASHTPPAAPANGFQGAQP